MDKTFVAKRIREERLRCGLSQKKVAEEMGWEASGHSIVAQIESGLRELKAWELYRLAGLFHVEPEVLFEEAKGQAFILWRGKPTGVVAEREQRLIQRCEEYRFLEEVLEDRLPIQRTLPRYELDLEKAGIEWAVELAETVRGQFGLGDFPATTLPQVLEEHYGVRFLMLPMEEGSAACTVMSFGPALLLNEKETSWRQIFSMAHELFHLITWDENVLRIVKLNTSLEKKNERLANAFAAALLMPENALQQKIRHLQLEGRLKFSTVIAVAREYRVSTEALLYRLQDLGFISAEGVEQTLKDGRFRWLDQQSFSKVGKKLGSLGDRFIRLAYLAYQFGKVSRSRLARLFRISLPSLESYLHSQGFLDIDHAEESWIAGAGNRP